MALLSCPECKKEVSEKEDKAPIPPKKKSKVEKKPSDKEVAKEEIAKDTVEDTAEEGDKPKKAILKYRPLND